MVFGSSTILECFIRNLLTLAGAACVAGMKNLKPEKSFEFETQSRGARHGISLSQTIQCIAIREENLMP